MNYLIEERQNALASEYVLGTLHGPARVRYQRLLMQYPSMRQSLWYWERYLNAMGGALPSVAPRPQVWENIQARLGFDETSQAPVNNVVRLPIQRTPHRWQWLAGLSTAAAILFAVMLMWPQPASVPPAPAQVAIVQGDKAQALWLIELGADTLEVQATDKLQAQTDKDYELWLVAADGRAPISLGVLPKQDKLVLPRIALMDQVEIAALAVSLEPLGGSPTGQPTTVLYTAELVTL